MSTNDNLVFSPKEFCRLLVEGRHDELSAQLLDILDRVGRLNIRERTDETLLFADVFIQNLTYCLCQSAFQPMPEDAGRFVDHNGTIANLAALSRHGTTDVALGILLKQKGPLTKILTLYSAFNSIELDPRPFFDADPILASRWWFGFFGTDSGILVSPHVLRRLRAHLARIDERLTVTGTGTSFISPYYLITYADLGREATVKARLNGLIRKHWPAPPPKPRRISPKRILVLSAFWYRSHAVWRTNQKFVASLAGKYRLTLVTLGLDHADYDVEPFDRVVRLAPNGDGLDIQALRDLGAMVAFYPDVGMSPLSVILANHRICPIQLMTHGHPSSTFGSEIDYYVSGCDIEDAETARHYSERLVLISGRGVDPTHPAPAAPPVDKPETPLTVCCPWSAAKTNAEIVALLRRIADGVGRPVHFHFLPGTGLRRGGQIPFEDALRAALAGSAVTVHPQLKAEEYLAVMDKAHLALDSYPFGGFNTVVDALGRGVPIVAYERDRAFNRFGAHFLRKAGLGDLVAHDDDGYVGKAVAILTDRRHREDLERRIRAIDHSPELYTDSANSFPQLVEYLIANQTRLSEDKDRTPIVVGG